MLLDWLSNGSKPGEIGMAVDVTWLENEILGRQLSEKEHNLLASMFHEITCISGETIVSKGQDGGLLHILRSGHANVEVSNSGEDKETVAEIEAGNLFGELTFLNGKSATADVVATQDCVVYTLSRDELTSVIDKGEPQLAYLLFSTIMEHQSGVILKQRVTLAPELRKKNNQVMPMYAKIILATVVAGLVYIIFF